jgi:hypothetical protein
MSLHFLQTAERFARCGARLKGKKHFTSGSAGICGKPGSRPENPLPEDFLADAGVTSSAACCTMPTFVYAEAHTIDSIFKQKGLKPWLHC